MKCKVCKEEMAVAGAPGKRSEGLCWDHAVALGNALAAVKPIEIMKATGIVLAATNEVDQINDELQKHLGSMTLKRLGSF